MRKVTTRAIFVAVSLTVGFLLPPPHISAQTENDTEETKAMNMISNSNRILPHHHEKITFDTMKKYKI